MVASRARMSGTTRTIWLASSAATVALVSSLWAGQPEARRSAPYTTWSDYGGSADAMQYSALTQIDTTNVSRLELAWHFPVPDRTGNFGFNPIVVEHAMYVLGPENQIVALDAASGHTLWTHKPDGEGTPGNRGINYWESRDGSDRRLIFSAGGALREIDARTGKAITTFGENGRVPMRVGEPRVLGSPSGTPGRIFENLLITGSNTGERFFSAPGDIRAYDVVTGKLVWTFHTIPRPGEHGHETWPREAWKYAGGANTWGEMSLDAKRGIVYVPTGSPTHDVFGGDRQGKNLFANSLLALDARTGKRLWHFQAVHHDLWDYDLTAAPKLLTVRHDGRLRDIVVQAAKHGFLFAFDRVSGEPLWPIEERPVPKSGTLGEHASPTQPFPTRPAPFARQLFTRDQINPYLTDDEKARVLERFTTAANEGLFTPLVVGREQFVMPGQFGGANWGATAADPTTGMLYVRTTDHPTISELREFDPNEPNSNQAQPSAREDGLRLFAGKRYTGPLGQAFRAKSGLSAIAPPWSEIVAYDMNDGTIKWRAPFGTSPALAARGITNTGNGRRAWRNGPVVTAGSVIFLGSWADRTVRAFDARNGKPLWEYPLKANPEGIVAVFEIDGRQYVALCASGMETTETPVEQAFEALPGLASAQGYYVFALPQTSR